MNRGAGRRIVFHDDSEREFFLRLVADLEGRFGTEVHCFCLLDNHFHLLIRSSEGRLSEAMGWLGSRFTRWANAGRRVDGAVFRGRFTSVLVERDAHLDWLFRYVNANPLDLGWRGRLAAYRWSGLATTLGRSSSYPWLRTDFALARFGDDPARLEAFVESARSTAATDQPKSLTDEVIRAAVEIARAPGPNVNSDADVRAAHTLVADRAGIPNPSTIAHLGSGSRQVYLDRAHGRRQCDENLRQLVQRVEAILCVEEEALHRVPDTGWVGSVCGHV
jgi:putative transposase